MKVNPLPPEELFQECDIAQLNFETTDDLEELEGFVGQPRAAESLEFGTTIQHEGYNIFASGSSGTGKFRFVRRLLEEKAAKEPVPSDLCYVYNFKEPHKPCILVLPAGKGKGLARDMDTVIQELGNVLRAAFENEEYQNRRQSLAQELIERQQEAFEELQREAEQKQLRLLRTPAGFAFAPVRNGEVIPPDEFERLSEEQRRKVEQDAEELQQKTQKIFQRLPTWEREAREKLRQLNREITGYAIQPLLDEIRRRYSDLGGVTEYLNTVEEDIVHNVEALLSQDAGSGGQAMQVRAQQRLGSSPVDGSQSESPIVRRYKVNVIVDHSESEGVPVVYEDNPVYQNLLGRVEHIAHMGTLLTDFNMIRAGAIHRANGGYLILDALKLLTEPFAWEGLKRALRSREAKIESLGQRYSLISTISLEPEPVPLSIKVVLLGPPILYYLLRQFDPEFPKLFKVVADFDTVIDRTPEALETYSRLIAGIIKREQLRKFHRDAVARVIEQSARLVSDKEKLSIHLQSISDLIREADYWASQNGRDLVTREDVQQAIDAMVYRSDLLREKMQELIKRNTILIDTEGSKVGQVNGLSVISLGDFSFGRPSRITARIRLGKGELVDIEREVEMGGPIHSKGVLILAGFLGARYAMNRPLSLSASLVFEQSYSGVEGDSASSAELYALLSAISEIPIKQSLAVTGSVNQHGQIQPIGGVNEKIEGFFDICKARGLT
ncbi:MAG TPA: ATP-binding protein, partial [Acidobacteriota bacterium]|nr:ATP-binding protein [Acidobacteriota bacterium]